MLRRFSTIIGFAVLAINALAQPIQQRMILPDSLASAEADWADLDNDGLLDILLFMKAKSGKDYVRILKSDLSGSIIGDTVHAMIKERSFPIISYTSYILADYDRDNAIDIIISGKDDNSANSTMLYRNKGNFKFEKTVTSIPYFAQACFADFDDDATPELVVSGSDPNGPYTKILKHIDGSNWLTVHDSLKLECSSMQPFDADGDGDIDLFLSGTSGTGAPMSGFFINKSHFFFKPQVMSALRGNTFTGDLDGDGFFEVVLMGEDESGSTHTKKYQYTSGAFIIQDLPVKLRNGDGFIADFDHDGTADINYRGMDEGGAPISFISYSNGTTLSPGLPTGSIRFGDRLHDGNLEFVYTMVEEGSLILAVGEELSKIENISPGKPVNAVALPVFDRVFMYWDKPLDDHTAKASLTYDVFLDGARNYQAGEFDLGNEMRLTVTHGNNGTNNFRLLKDVEPEDLNFAIQAIDNSFHAGPVCVGTLGGVGGPSSPCTPTVAIDNISVCSYEKIVLKAPSEALWFSFKDGFLGIRSDFSFSAANSEKGDTIFYYRPTGVEECSSLKAWTIQIDNDTSKIEIQEKFACNGAPVELSVEPGWQTVSWKSDKTGDLGTSNNIQISVAGPDSITVRLGNSQGCEIVRKTALKISAPLITVTAEHYKIIKGGEVQLQASGGQRYSWTPATGLSQDDISDPIASPTSSLQYVVTGYDSLDCAGQATITVTVESGGFIPNLFSPNDDGQNDQLRIYGLSSADGFSFTIYDREGSLVYGTSDLTEAVQRGWDGTKNGSKQPPGVYFWKVKGEIGPDRLLLNGKDSGSLVLIR